MSDLIDRQAAIDAVLELDVHNRVSWKDSVIDTIDALPPAQPEAVISKQEYAEFFLGWLEEYRKQSAKLQGRYLPFEVLGWAASDFRKCFPERSVEP